MPYIAVETFSNGQGAIVGFGESVDALPQAELEALKLRGLVAEVRPDGTIAPTTRVATPQAQTVERWVLQTDTQFLARLASEHPDIDFVIGLHKAVKAAGRDLLTAALSSVLSYASTAAPPILPTGADDAPAPAAVKAPSPPRPTKAAAKPVKKATKAARQAPPHRAA